jgi:folate-dependent phosphoribosylglycinamide formyltransferase PurN
MATRGASETERPGAAKHEGAIEVAEVTTTTEDAAGRQTVTSFSLRRLTLPVPLKLHLSRVEKLLKREEADLILIAGNVALVAYEIVEWPVAALTLTVHALARTRFKGLEALAEVVEEVE